MKPLKAVSRDNPETTSTRGQEVRPVSTEKDLISTFRDMERLMEESFGRPFFGITPFRRLFNDLGRFGEFTPSVDIYEEGNNLLVKAEIPGINKEDIEVKVVNNTLVLSGEKKTEEKVERKDYLRLERSSGSFSRTLALPEGIDSDNIEATYKDGILEIKIPRIEESKVHTVTVH